MNHCPIGILGIHFLLDSLKDPAHSRPIAAPDSNQIVISANDGSLFRWDEDINPKDVFWFKDMKYSLSDIFFFR